MIEVDKAAAMQRIGDATGFTLVSGADLSTPIESTQDGPRMSGKVSNFGGKKAAPFRKGGKRRAKVLAAKSAMRGKRKDTENDGDMSNTGTRDIGLAKLSKAERDSLPASAFVFPASRRYPIHDKAHARAAVLDSAGKPEHAQVVAAVRARYGK